MSEPIKGCDCIQKTAAQLRSKLLASADHFETFAPKGATGLERVDATNMALMFSSGRWALNIPFTVQWIGVKKETSVPIIASHCPFCGKAFPTA